MLERLAVPLLDGIWRIGQHYIKLLYSAPIGKSGSFKCVVVHNREIVNTVQVKIHTGNGRSTGINFLPKDLHIAPFLTFVLQVGETLNQHTARATGGVVYTLMGLQLKYFSHQFHYRAVGVKLLCRMTGIVGKLANQVFITRSHLVSWTSSQ